MFYYSQIATAHGFLDSSSGVLFYILVIYFAEQPQYLSRRKIFGRIQKQPEQSSMTRLSIADVLAIDFEVSTTIQATKSNTFTNLIRQTVVQKEVHIEALETCSISQ